MTTRPDATPWVERDPDDDHPVFHHDCGDRDPEFTRIGGKLPLGPDGWQWQADGSLTPSILCHACNTHGFWDGPERGWRSA